MDGNSDSRIILLVNLGSPKSTSLSDVRKYLRQFLMDKFVIDAPYMIRKFIVECLVLPFRPKISAEAYKKIWLEEGSPLVVLSERLTAGLSTRTEHPVALAMRYGNRSIPQVIDELAERYPQAAELFLLPLYPHYAMATTQTVINTVEGHLARKGYSIKLKVQPPFYDDNQYIEALYLSMKPYFDQPFDHILFSYHGLPKRHILKSDSTGKHCLKKKNCCSTSSVAHKTCYRHQTYRTTQLLAKRAGLAPDRFTLCFQSRIGLDSWLQPASADTILRLADQGVKKLLVACPSFVTDCLETLEEIGIQGKNAFLAAGGESFELIPCLNTHPAWVEVLARWCNDDIENSR